MATVRFSEDLIHKIANNARDTFGKRYVEAGKFPDDIGDRLYNFMFKDYIDKMNALPPEFFDRFTEFTINRFGTVTLQHTFKLTNSRGFPEGYPANSSVKKGWRTNELHCQTVDDPEFYEFESLFIARADRLRDLDQQRDKFVNGVNEICCKFTTLAPALKAWPPLWDLLPQATKDRHLEITERKSAAAKTEELLSEIDLSSMTANVVASKLVR